VEIERQAKVWMVIQRNRMKKTDKSVKFQGEAEMQHGMACHSGMGI